MSLVCILYALKNKRSGLTVEELAYYFTLLIAISSHGDKYVIDYSFIQNIYLDVEHNIKKKAIILVNTDLVNLNKDSTKKVLKFMISPKGDDIVGSLESEYYRELFNKIEYIRSEVPFSAKNKKIMWRSSWEEALE